MRTALLTVLFVSGLTAFGQENDWNTFLKLVDNEPKLVLKIDNADFEISLYEATKKSKRVSQVGSSIRQSGGIRIFGPLNHVLNTLNGINNQGRISNDPVIYYLRADAKNSNEFGENEKRAVLKILESSEFVQKQI